MKTLKEYFKARLTQKLDEDFMTAGLADALTASQDAHEKKYEETGDDVHLERADNISYLMDRLARSPKLYDLKPGTVASHGVVPGAKLHRGIQWALSGANEHGTGIHPDDVAEIRKFIEKYGHIIGGVEDSERFDTRKRVLGNIFDSPPARHKRK